jgi:hypothetical protein
MCSRYRSQVVSIVSGMFEHNKDLLAFKAHLRDFLITLKVISKNFGAFNSPFPF